MTQAIIDKFKKIGAEARVRYLPTERTVFFKGWRGSPGRWVTQKLTPAPFVINIVEEKGKEVFDIAIGENFKDRLDMQVLEVSPEQRHLVLFAKQPSWTNRPVLIRGTAVDTPSAKMHFLCGHDERHWFVAGVHPCSTVLEAKNSLKPRAILDAEAKAGLKNNKKHKRHNEAWIRQGEWFFEPAPDLKVDELSIRKEEPITRSGTRGRGAGKPHTAQFSCRAGGTQVWTMAGKNRGQDIVISDESYNKLDPSERGNYKSRMRDPILYVRGTVKHLDHATIDLGTVWHRVLMNRERHELRGNTVAFLD